MELFALDRQERSSILTFMHVPFIDLRRQIESLRIEFDLALADVLDSGQFIMGTRAARLEQQVAEYLGGHRHAVAVNSGTDALFLALRCLGIGTGDQVITTPYSFFATAEAIALAGAEPVFVDIDAVTYNLSPERLADRLRTGRLERVKAIIPVHLFGQCADMASILELAQSYGLPVIEDACQGIGAECVVHDDIRRAGSMGRLGCFSFYPTKNLGGFGDGGMIVTPGEKLAEGLRALRNHGQAGAAHANLGANSRLDEIQAAVLLVKLNHLDSWNRARQERALFYDRHLADVVETPKANTGSVPVFHQYVIRTEERDSLKAWLEEHDVETGIYYPAPIHLEPAFRSLNFQPGSFPEAERAARETLALPIYPELTREEQEYVVAMVKEWREQRDR